MQDHSPTIPAGLIPGWWLYIDRTERPWFTPDPDTWIFFTWYSGTGQTISKWIFVFPAHTRLYIQLFKSTCRHLYNFPDWFSTFFCVLSSHVCQFFRNGNVTSATNGTIYPHMQSDGINVHQFLSFLWCPVVRRTYFRIRIKLQCFTTVRQACGHCVDVFVIGFDRRIELGPPVTAQP